MKEITGRQVLIGTVAAFGVIIAANMTLAVNAVRTFPGLEVKNSYVASQEFEAARDAQDALGWDVSAEIAGGELRLSIIGPDGTPVRAVIETAILGKATHVRADQTPAFVWQDGMFVAPVDVETGNWNLRLVAVAEDGTTFRQRIVLPVRS